MKLHSPEFERTLKRGVKKAIRKSPALKREYRAANKFRRHYSSYFLGRFAIWFIIGVIVSLLAISKVHPAAALGIISLWIFIFVFLHANSLFLRLFGSTDLAILLLLPVSRDIIFRWELQKFVRYALFSLVDVLVALGTLACLSGFSAAKWFAVALISILAWALSLALGALCAARVDRLKYFWVSKFLFPSLVMSFFAIRAVPKDLLVGFINHAAPFLNFLLPTGWAISLFQLLLPNPDWLLVLFIVPVITIIWTMPNSLARLRRLYVFREVEHTQVNDLEPEPRKIAPESPSSVPPPVAGLARRRGPTEIAEIIRSRRFFSLPRWPENGWWEALLWGWYTPRERALSEFAFPDGVCILKPWKKIGFILAVAVAAGFITGPANQNAGVFIISFGIVVTAILTLACVNESGKVFRLALNSGVRIPIYAYYPITLPETERLLLKLTVVQIPLLLSWSMVCGILFSHLMGFPLVIGFQAGLRGGCLLFASRFFFAVFGLSSGTNDTQRLGIRNILLLVCIAPFAILFLAFVGTGLFLPQQGIAWSMTALGILDAYIFFRIYAWFYNRNFFDLMNLPQQRSF